MVYQDLRTSVCARARWVPRARAPEPRARTLNKKEERGALLLLCAAVALQEPYLAHAHFKIQRTPTLCSFYFDTNRYDFIKDVTRNYHYHTTHKFATL